MYKTANKKNTNANLGILKFYFIISCKKQNHVLTNTRKRSTETSSPSSLHKTYTPLSMSTVTVFLRSYHLISKPTVLPLLLLENITNWTLLVLSLYVYQYHCIRQFTSRLQITVTEYCLNKRLKLHHPTFWLGAKFHQHHDCLQVHAYIVKTTFSTHYTRIHA